LGVAEALLIHGMNQQRLEVTKLTLKLADSNWEIFNSYPNSATPIFGVAELGYDNFIVRAPKNNTSKRRAYAMS